MQQVINRPPTPPNTPTRGASRSRSVFIVALILFAVAGLASGYVMGALTKTKPSSQPQTLTPQGTATKVSSEPKESPTTAVKPITPQEVGCPSVLSYQPAMQADGATPYSITVQATDTSKSICDQKNKPLKTQGITFKFWLIPNVPLSKRITFSQETKNKYLKNVNNLNEPIPVKVLDKNGKSDEGSDATEVTGISFDSSTPQVQKSDKLGKCTWKYTVGTEISPGPYTAIVLIDWNGYYNWSWFNVTLNRS